MFGILRVKIYHANPTNLTGVVAQVVLQLKLWKCNLLEKKSFYNLQTLSF